MKKNKNFEETFKEKFETFEAEPTPESWKKIAAAVGVGATAATGGIAWYLSFGKIMVIASIIGSVSIGGYFFLKEKKNLITADNSTVSVKENETVPEKTEPAISFPENEVAYSSEIKKSEPTATSVVATDKKEPIVVQPEIKKETRRVEPKTTNAIAEKPKSEYEILKEKSASITNVPLAKELKTMPENREEKPSIYTHIPNKKPEISPEESKNDELNTNAYLKLALIAANHVTGYAPLAVTFTNAGSAASNKWRFGDGTVSQESNPFHIFEKAGKYKVTLIATDYNRTETDTITVNVNGSSFIAEIPTVFTPNGDGKNDEFKITGHDIISLKVTIVSNTTGKEVYKWNTVEGSWNGRMFNGEAAPAGTYLYIYEAEGVDGKKYPFTKGQIKIQR